MGRPDHYEWAIVTAGQPTVEKSDGCTIPDSCSNPAQFSCGLWFFSRKPVADKEMMEQMMAAAKKKGISTQALITVDQSDCDYSGYVIKSNERSGTPSANTQ